jgi:peptidoglycan hydrolase CwlO-like protein
MLKRENKGDKMTKKEIQNEIKEIQKEIKELSDKMLELALKRDSIQESMDSFELDPDDYEDEYIKLLNDEYPDVDICGYSWNPVYILRERDPTAFRCGLLDYVDTLDVTESEEYKEMEDDVDDLNYEIDTIGEDILKLEDEIDELEDELEEANG